MTNMDKHIQTYRQEAEELLSDIELTVLDLEQNPGDKEKVNRLFRDMHTIKGSGAMFGFQEVAAFTHHVENVLSQVRDGKIPVSGQLIDLILASRDHIKSMFFAFDSGQAVDTKTGERIIAQLKTLMSEESDESESDMEEMEEDDETIEKSTPVERTWRIRFHPDPDIIRSGLEPGLILEDLRRLGDVQVLAHTDVIPDLEKLHADACYLSWDILLITTQKKKTIEDVFIFVADKSVINIQPIDPPASTDSKDDVPKLGEILVDRGDVDIQKVKKALGEQKRIGELLVKSGTVDKTRVKSALTEQRLLEKQKASAVASSIRISSEKLDKLINLVGELVITQAHLSQLVGSLEDMDLSAITTPMEVIDYLTGELGGPVETLERLTGELRDCALNMRMLPIGTIFGRFRRLVRDLSAELGKEIDLVTEGAETELDKTVIERLSDPLIHLIRNSIDHGIQTPDLRLELGKPRRGKIQLKAAHKGANVVITIEDDGKGIDWENVRLKAIEKGLVKPEESLDENEIMGLLFTPGFSTASEVTNVSGRGVGMDVVKREIDALGGSIQIKTEPGKFLKISLILPLTLAIIDGLLVNISGNLYILPLAMVDECMELSRDMIQDGHKRNMILVRDELVPYVRLREIFLITNEYPDVEHVAIAKVGSFRVGIVVDEIIGNIQTVIKSLDRNFENAYGFSGATIMGNGTVALILDVPGIVRLAQLDEARRFVKKM